MFKFMGPVSDSTQAEWRYSQAALFRHRVGMKLQVEEKPKMGMGMGTVCACCLDSWKNARLDVRPARTVSEEEERYL